MILANLKHHLACAFNLQYHHRESFKGVNGRIEYPLISIDTEHSAEMRDLRSRELQVTGKPETTAKPLLDFVKSFMKVAKIEFPFFSDCENNANLRNLPKSYTDFTKYWRDEKANINSRDAVFQQSETLDDTQTGSIPNEVCKFSRTYSIRFLNSA